MIGHLRRALLTTVVFILLTTIMIDCSTIAFAQDNTNDGNIVYSKFGSTFLYSNNPEVITVNDLGDSDLGNRIIYQENNVYGLVQAFLSHYNKTGGNIYFGIQIYNPTSSTDEITVNNKGYSVDDWSGVKCWQQFYSTINQVYSIPAKGSIWILGDESTPIANGSVVDGVIRFNVSGTVQVNFYAYKDFKKINGTAKYEGYITKRDNTDDQTRVYKGKSDFPLLMGSFSWTVNDSTSIGNLPVSYNGKKYDSWITNITQNVIPDAMNSDMLSFNTPDYPGGIGPTTKDPSGRICNLGNWGVQYIDRITITNTGKKNRKVQFLMSAPISGASEIVNVVFETSGGAKSKSFNNSSDIYSICEFDVSGGSSITKEIRLVLTAHSCGGLCNYIKLVQ